MIPVIQPPIEEVDYTETFLKIVRKMARSALDNIKVPVRVVKTNVHSHILEVEVRVNKEDFNYVCDNMSRTGLCDINTVLYIRKGL